MSDEESAVQEQEAVETPESARERIKTESDEAREAVYVPHWDVHLEVRSLSLVEQTRLEKACSGMANEDAGVRTLIEHICIPGSNKRFFDEGDVDWLKHRSWGAIEILYDAMERVRARRQNTVEAAEKNSPAAHSE